MDEIGNSVRFIDALTGNARERMRPRLAIFSSLLFAVRHSQRGAAQRSLKALFPHI